MFNPRLFISQSISQFSKADSQNLTPIVESFLHLIRELLSVSVVWVCIKTKNDEYFVFKAPFFPYNTSDEILCGISQNFAGVSGFISDFQRDDRFADYLDEDFVKDHSFFASFSFQIEELDLEGTLCLFDSGTRRIELSQQKIIKLLVEQFLDHITSRILLLKYRNAGYLNEEKIKEIFESVNTVVWFSDPIQNKLRYISPNHADLWDIGNEDLYENPESFINILHPDDHDTFVKVIEDRKDGTIQSSDNIYRVRKPGGKYGLMKSYVFPIRDENNELISLMGVSVDITS